MKVGRSYRADSLDGLHGLRFDGLYSAGSLPFTSLVLTSPCSSRYSRVSSGTPEVESSNASHNSSNENEGGEQPGVAENAPNPESHSLTQPDSPSEATNDTVAVEIHDTVETPSGSSQLGGEGSTPVGSAVQQASHGFLRRGSHSNNSTSSEKICLICLEPLSHEDFENGEAMVLECQCKGDAALRHKDCAQKWVDIKGDLTCDICRAPISNLNAPRPRSDAGSQQLSEDATDASRGRYPSATDVFDCIRMTWVVTIVCILFFNLKIASALVTGLLIAVMYTWSCQLLRCAQFQADNTENGQTQDANSQEDVPNENPPQHAVPAIIII